MRSKPTSQAVPLHVRQRRLERRRHLRQLGYEDYGAYLRSAHWRDLKARYRASHLRQGCICGEQRSVQLHHKTYDRIGDERLTDLVPLCVKCHRMIHVLDVTGEAGLDFDGITSAERAAAYAAADPVTARRQQLAKEKPAPKKRSKWTDDGSKWALLRLIAHTGLPTDDLAVDTARLRELQQDGLIEQRYGRKGRLLWKPTDLGRAALHDPLADISL